MGGRKRNRLERFCLVVFFVFFASIVGASEVFESEVEVELDDNALSWDEQLFAARCLVASLLFCHVVTAILMSAVVRKRLLVEVPVPMILFLSLMITWSGVENAMLRVAVPFLINMCLTLKYLASLVMVWTFDDVPVGIVRAEEAAEEQEDQRVADLFQCMEDLPQFSVLSLTISFTFLTTVICLLMDWYSGNQLVRLFGYYLIRIDRPIHLVRFVSTFLSC